MCRLNKFDFPHISSKSKKRVYGFQTGDQVRAKIIKGKKAGCDLGRVVIRKTESFDMITQKNGSIQGITKKYFHLIQKADRYEYS